MILTGMSTRKPLVIRLRNFVGDVVLTVPTLQRMHDAGYELWIVGEERAASLLAGHGWQVMPYARTTRERVAQLRALRRATELLDPGFARQTSAITFSGSPAATPARAT